ARLPIVSVNAAQKPHPGASQAPHPRGAFGNGLPPVGRPENPFISPRRVGIMRPSPIISAIGTGALALGMSIAVAPSAGATTLPAEPSTDNVADTMQEALERDFGLTPFGAEELLEAQAEASEIDAEAAEAAGDHYGGSFFDTESLELTVNVTDAQAAEQVEAAGAQAEVVQYGHEALTGVIDDLDATGGEDGVVSWYPDVANDTVVVQANDAEAAQSLIESADVDASAVEVEQTEASPELYAD